MSEDVKVGQNVHLGFATKGGAGFEGVVTKVDGDTVFVESAHEKGKTFKGPKRNVTIQNQAFQTGAARATAAIMNKAASVGVRVGNSDLTQDGYIEVACVTQYPGEGKFETLEEGPSAEWIFDKLKKQMRGGKLPVYVEVKGGVHGNLKWGA